MIYNDIIIIYLLAANEIKGLAELENSLLDTSNRDQQVILINLCIHVQVLVVWLLVEVYILRMYPAPTYIRVYIYIYLFILFILEYCNLYCIYILPIL